MFVKQFDFNGLFLTVSLPNRNMFDKELKQLEELLRPQTIGLRRRHHSSTMVERYV